MSVELVNETDTELDLTRLSALARFVLDDLRIHPMAELGVRFVEEAAMEHLHVTYLDEPGPTDVMSWPMDELRPPSDDEEPEPGLLGDVVVCPSVAAGQARAAGHSLQREIDILLTHGILHLLGYDHAEPEDERAMFALQEDLVNRFVQREVDPGGSVPDPAAPDGTRS